MALPGKTLDQVRASQDTARGVGGRGGAAVEGVEAVSGAPLGADSKTAPSESQSPMVTYPVGEYLAGIVRVNGLPHLGLRGRVVGVGGNWGRAMLSVSFCGPESWPFSHVSSHV